MLGLNLTKEGWSHPLQEDGHTYSMWLGGHAAYGACIFVSNLVVFHRHYSHQAIGLALIFLMTINFFWMSEFESRTVQSDPTIFPDIAGVFQYFYKSESVLVWLTLILACLGVSAGEIILRYKQDVEEKEWRDNYDANVKKQNEMFESKKQKYHEAQKEKLSFKR